MTQHYVVIRAYNDCDFMLSSTLLVTILMSVLKKSVTENRGKIRKEEVSND